MVKSSPSRKTSTSVAKAIDRKIGNISVAPRVEFKITVADVAKIATGQPAGPGIDLTPTLQGLWGWIIPNLPGKRYRKILTRAVATDRQYAQIENRLRTVWGG